MSQPLHYKQYDGSVERSAEHRTLHGSMLGIRDMVTFEGETVTALEPSFQAAVEDYLVLCAAHHKRANA